MKRSKTYNCYINFFLVIAVVIIARTMIGAIPKKFSKRPPPGIIVTDVRSENFLKK